MPKNKTRKTILKLVRHTFSDLIKCEEIDVKEAYRLPDKKVKLKLKGHPILINLYPDSKILHLYPEQDLTGSGSDTYLLFDPDTYFSGIGGFYRLKDGDKITLGGGNREQRTFLHISRLTPKRKLSIRNEQGALTFKSHVSNPKTCIAPLLKDKKLTRIAAWRKAKLKRLAALFSGKIAPLTEKQACMLLQKASHILQNEPLRARDDAGKPGGVVALPDDSRVFIVGDLHAKTDNLLTLLTQNGFLEALEEKTASLIILGDAVHSEEPGEYADMDGSLLIMDVILQLMVAFPGQVFYLRGNHDSFSDDIAKGGVLQGVLWEKALLKARGKAYRKELARFYDLLPYVIYSRHFIACHASPPTGSASMEMLVNIRKYPKLIRDIINNRAMRPGRPCGYTRGDVKRFRKLMKVGADTPLIVGHTPMSSDETIWEKVGEIDHHYIVYGSDRKWIGVMTQIGEAFYPLRYPVEPIVGMINATIRGQG